MIVRFGRMTTKKHVTAIVDGGRVYVGLTQEPVGISTSGSPEGIEHDAQIRVSNRLEIDDLTQPGQVVTAWIQVGRFQDRCTGRSTFLSLPIGILLSIASRNLCFDSFRHFRQRRRPVRRGELDAVVFWRIVRGSKVNSTVSLFANYSVRDRRRWSGLWNQQGCNPMSNQNPACHRAKGLAQKTRIAAHNHTCTTGFLRNYVA